MMETIYSSETPVSVRTAWRFDTEDCTPNETGPQILVKVLNNKFHVISFSGFGVVVCGLVDRRTNTMTLTTNVYKLVEDAAETKY
jgi:hypothetical protein